MARLDATAVCNLQQASSTLRIEDHARNAGRQASMFYRSDKSTLAFFFQFMGLLNQHALQALGVSLFFLEGGGKSWPTAGSDPGRSSIAALSTQPTTSVQ